MTLAIDISNEYLAWDNPERVIFRQRRTADDLVNENEVATALRMAVTQREMATSAGAYTALDTVWQLPAVMLTWAPRPGDQIVSDFGLETATTWTIMPEGVKRVALGSSVSHYRCVARDLVLVNELLDVIEIHRATNAQDAAAARIPGYAAVYEGVSAKIQEISADETQERGKRGFRRIFEVYVGEQLNVTLEDRLVAADGTIYEIKGYTGPGRIDQLMVLNVELTP